MVEETPRFPMAFEGGFTASWHGITLWVRHQWTDYRSNANALAVQSPAFRHIVVSIICTREV